MVFVSIKFAFCIYQLHHVDGLTLSGVKELLKAREHHAEDFITLTGDSGHVWGAVRIELYLYKNY